MKHSSSSADQIRQDLENMDLDITEIAYVNGVSEAVVRAIATEQGIDMRTRTKIHKARKGIQSLEEQIEADLEGLHKNSTLL